MILIACFFVSFKSRAKETPIMNWVLILIFHVSIGVGVISDWFINCSASLLIEQMGKSVLISFTTDIRN